MDTEEKNLSKYNARALNAIFGGVDEDEFKLIQFCNSVKKVWDILQKSHEGTTSVKRTRLDQLASDFENLNIDPEETIVQFSSKISVIANEVVFLEKPYKEPKLVKKLLRCLPPNFAAHKVVMRVYGNNDSMKFEELVGMLKSEEMEFKQDSKVNGMSNSHRIAFKSEEKERNLTENQGQCCSSRKKLPKGLEAG